MPEHCRLIACVSLLLACSGTSSGNPADPGPDDNPPPIGIELAKSNSARNANPEISTDDSVTFGGDNRAFAFDLYAVLAKEQTNLFFSPLSISTALAMTYAGAKGATASEMAAVLHFTLAQPTLHSAFNDLQLRLLHRAEQVPSSAGGVGLQLDVVDQVWGQKGYPFSSSYLDVLATNYDAGLLLVDFAKPEAARRLINDWVSENTQQRIKDLLPDGSIDATTKLVLTDAIYFKASWFVPFDASQTTAAGFRAAAGERSVQMMHNALKLRYAAQANYQAVELPYLSPDVRMLMVLPAEGEFDSVAAGFDASFYDALSSSLSAYEVTLSLPRWTFDSRHKLKTPLQSLGIKAAFTASAADFSGMAGTKDLYIDEVYHDTLVAVDERGTEAAAATGVVINADGSVGPVLQQAEITFDRPFIFLIYDEPTGQILFIGHLRDPG